MLKWTVIYEEDSYFNSLTSSSSVVATAQMCISNLFINRDAQREAFEYGDRAARVALADYAARAMADILFPDKQRQELFLIEVLYNKQQHLQYGPTRRTYSPLVPFIFERTDVWCRENILYVSFRVTKKETTTASEEDKARENIVYQFLSNLYHQISTSKAMEHIACNVLQDKIRNVIKQKASIAFIANGSILPRKSGASQQPMSSPPAIPFQAPNNSDTMTPTTIVISMGALQAYLPSSNDISLSLSKDGLVSITGLMIPEGITLICGGGYHGKSTLLRTIACGVYNKLPGDGREYCVTRDDAVVVRAEDGRYVSNCNISAFVTNLPFAAHKSDEEQSSFYFSSSEASGSTSQATNVVEAIEMGASVLLVDEDTSAANFMARDGRMRALIQDESITPLLYRVNGLYNSLGISSIVVVGGVGDWLDVPHQVLLLNRYICHDATKKARSISEQFSYGHVQYAGRGVVHRLPWEKALTPRSRRLKPALNQEILEVVAVPGNDSRLFLTPPHPCGAITTSVTSLSDIDDDVDEHNGEIDMVRCEQLFGRFPQLLGCGLCVKWVLQSSKSLPHASVKDLLEMMERTMDENGGIRAMIDLPYITAAASGGEKTASYFISGLSYRPRKFEVAVALFRMRGLVLEDLPATTEDMNEEEKRVAEEERKKNELMELWQSRRKERN